MGKNKISKCQQFGKLTTIEYDNIHYNPPRWKCRCECGNIIYVRTALLNNGQVKSCGCSKNKGGISKNPYYSGFIKYNERNKNKFSDIQSYIKYRQEKNSKKSKLESKIQNWWKIVNSNQNGDFLNYENFYLFCEKKRGNKSCFTIIKKEKDKPYAKNNLQFGLYYNSKFISSYQFSKYHFNYDENKKLYYGYIKFKGHTFVTKKYQNFDFMLAEYCSLYKFYFDKDFSLT